MEQTRWSPGIWGLGRARRGKHVSDECADLNKALPELAIADDRAGTLLAGRRHHE